MIFKYKIKVFFLIFLFLTSGCNKFKAYLAQNLQRDKVITNVARLIGRDTSVMAKAVVETFDELNVPYEIKKDKEHANYGKGTATRTLKNYDMNFEEGKLIYKNCVGEEAIIKGKFKVIKATQSLYGRLTGNKKEPVIPDHDAVKITIHAKFNDMKVLFKSHKDTYLGYKKGEVTFELYPRLAQYLEDDDEDKKYLRIAQTANTLMKNIKVKNIEARLVSPDVEMPIKLNTSKFDIQIGQGEDGKENFINGFVNAFKNSRHKIPYDKNGFDPDYNRKKFIKTYSCWSGLKGKVSYKNYPFERKIGPGVAALTTLISGQIVQKLENDHKCGMASVEFLKNTEINGELGSVGSSVSTFEEDCKIKFNDFETKPDCFGIAYKMNGSVRVKAGSKKTLRGMVVFEPSNWYNEAIPDYSQKLAENENNPEELKKVIEDEFAPIMPITRQPANLKLIADLSKLSVTEVCLAQEGNVGHSGHCNKKNNFEPLKFGFKKGHITTHLEPVLAKNLKGDEKICKVPIPVAEAAISVKNLKARINKSGNTIKMLLNEGEYSAVSGKIGKKENSLNGALKINDINLEFNKEALKPDYDRDNYIASYKSCRSNEFEVVSDEQCFPKEMLVNGLVRTIVLNAGGVLKAGSRGFKSAITFFNNSNIRGDGLQIVNISSNSTELEGEQSGCDSSNPDCERDDLGNKTILIGQLYNTEAKLTRRGRDRGGFNLGAFRILYDSWRGVKEYRIRPTNYDSTKIKVRSDLVNFYAIREEVEKGKRPFGRIHNGTIEIKATPYMGINRTTIDENMSLVGQEPSYSVETPVAHFHEIKLENTAYSIELENGMRLMFYIGNTNLEAFNGFYEGEGNFVKGSIKFALGGRKPENEENYFDEVVEEMKLLPDYDQETFNRSYASYMRDKNLHDFIPHE